MGGKHDTKTINDVVNNEVATPKPVVDQKDVNNLLNIKTEIPYIEFEGGFIANPYSLLGRVVEVRKVNGQIPSSVTASNVEFSTMPIIGIKRDLNSDVKSPILRQSVIIDSKISANVNLFNYLSAEADAESVFSINVIDQSGGLVDVQDSTWAKGIKEWKADNADLLKDDDICYIYVIIGFIQKQIIRKKFKKFNAEAKGGYAGINVGGALYMSSDEYSMDIRYGLTPSILKRPKSSLTSDTKSLFGTSVENSEYELFKSLQNVRLSI